MNHINGIKKLISLALFTNLSNILGMEQPKSHSLEQKIKAAVMREIHFSELADHVMFLQERAAELEKVINGSFNMPVNLELEAIKKKMLAQALATNKLLLEKIEDKRRRITARLVPFQQETDQAINGLMESINLHSDGIKKLLEM